MDIYKTIFEIVNFSILGLFLISEIVINVFRRGNQREHSKNIGKISNSLIMIVGISSTVLGTIIGFTAKFMNIRWLFSPDYFISSLGLFLIFIGVIIRWSAILTLKKYFTVDVRIMADHKLIQSGLYKYIRHPSYLGLLVAALGLGITMVNWLSVIVIFIPQTVIILMRIKEEEIALANRFGSDFKEYQNNTKYIVPSIY